MPGEAQADLDDVTLLRRSAAGERGAFDVLVLRHDAALLRYARMLTGDDARAEDALQEAFVAAWQHAGTFRGPLPPAPSAASPDAPAPAGVRPPSARPWLLAILRRAVFRQSRRRVGEPPQSESIDALGEAAGFASPDLADTLERRLADRDALEHALAALALPDREVLLLSDVEGLSGDELAQALSLGHAAARSRLHRARLRLMAELRKEDSHEG